MCVSKPWRWGKLVIASASGGQAEMIGMDGDSGHSVQLGEARRLRMLLSNRRCRYRSSRFRSIGARARARITALTSFETVLPQRLAHFERVIADRRPRRIFPGLTAGTANRRRMLLLADTVPGLLSVVVPYYNLGAYLAETIASIVAASYRPLEIDR
jgi:glycogen(starch) synthase